MIEITVGEILVFLILVILVYILYKLGGMKYTIIMLLLILAIAIIFKILVTSSLVERIIAIKITI